MNLDLAHNWRLLILSQLSYSKIAKKRFINYKAGSFGGLFAFPKPLNALFIRNVMGA